MCYDAHFIIQDQTVSVTFVIILGYGFDRKLKRVYFGWLWPHTEFVSQYIYGKTSIEVSFNGCGSGLSW